MKNQCESAVRWDMLVGNGATWNAKKHMLFNFKLRKVHV